MARALAKQPQHRFAGLFRVDVELLDFEPPRLDLGEIENIVDDRQQVLTGFRAHVGVTARAAGQFAARQQFGHDQDAVHRRADLVAHGGEEVGFGLIGRLGFRSGCLEVAGAVGDLLFQEFEVLVQAPVALVSIVDHRIEAGDQHAHFVATFRPHRDAVVARIRDPPYRRGQSAQRLNDRVLQAGGQPERRKEPAESADHCHADGRPDPLCRRSGATCPPARRRQQ